MKVVTAAEMREIDRSTIEEYGIPSLVLMERAGVAVAARVRDLYGPRKVLVLSGGGNNGGDGLVVARNLHNWGFRVRVVVFSEEADLSRDCRTQYQIVRKTGIPVTFRRSLYSEDLHGAVVIDAIFGTGLGRPVEGDLAAVFRFVNETGVPVIAVDMPSGVSSDTGQILGEAIKADYTVTFGLPKRGHVLHPGAAYTGRLFVEDIGFPSALLASERLKANLVDSAMAAKRLPRRARYSYKGDYGHVLVIAGSKGKTGAALLSARACLRSGSGLVTIGVPESLTDVFQGRVTDEMTLPLPDDGRGRLSFRATEEILSFTAQRIDVMAIGPGIGMSEDTETIMSQLIQNSPVPLVIDADGINSLKGRVETLLKAKSPILLTPHPGEMRRLLARIRGENFGIKEIEEKRIAVALSAAEEMKACVVLKGVPTVVATPAGDTFVNTSGNPGMATGGSGDVLTGIISSLWGQGLAPADAAWVGVYLHGLAGDLAAREKGEYSLTATDIIDHLPHAFHALLNERQTLG